jgi:hypothetical protein
MPIYYTEVMTGPLEAVITLSHIEEIKVGDGLIRGYNEYEVTEVTERRPAKGVFDLDVQPEFFRCKCKLVNSTKPQPKK